MRLVSALSSTASATACAISSKPADISLPSGLARNSTILRAWCGVLNICSMKMLGKEVKN
jgi:hypothetical protein